jgi:F-type H+-transporting ATPase subunit a
VAEPKKRGLFGLPSPVVIAIAVIILGVVILALLVGPIGQGLLKSFGITLTFPAWITIAKPTPHLPAPVVFHLLGWGVTNSMVGTWLTVVFLIVISLLVTRRMKLVPGRLQGLFEGLLGWLYDFLTGIAGEEHARSFFPVVCTIFLFVLFNAWLSLIPGFVSLEIKRYEPLPAATHVVAAGDSGGELTLVNDNGTPFDMESLPGESSVIANNGEYQLLEKEELIRGANTDINTPLAIAVVSFFFVLFFGLKELRFGYIRQYLNFGPFFRSIGAVFTGKFNLLGIFSGFIDAFVGLLEGLGVLIRILSFTFRLFGNMTAGEVLLLIIAFLVPWIVSPVFYVLELLIGFVQALVFAGLTAVFVTMAVTPHEGESHG